MKRLLSHSILHMSHALQNSLVVGSLVGLCYLVINNFCEWPFSHEVFHQCDVNTKLVFNYINMFIIRLA